MINKILYTLISNNCIYTDTNNVSKVYYTLLNMLKDINNKYFVIPHRDILIYTEYMPVGCICCYEDMERVIYR